MELKAKINQQARSEEKRKIRLEKRFEPVIKSLFARMAKDFENRYIATGQILDFRVFKDDWTGALKRQYVRVGKEFTNNARKSAILGLLIKQEDELIIEEIAAIAAAYAIFAQSLSVTQAAFIINTSNKDAVDAVLLSLRELREENLFREPTNTEVARRSSKKLRKSFKGRVGLIANANTQNPAEEAKSIEAKVIAKQPVLPFQTIEDVPKRTIKQWADIGDGRERVTHAVANGQKVDINEVFTVGGFSLKNPGDGSLGAPLKETANCRCSQIFLTE